MKEKLKKFSTKFLDIFLTALASALLACLQQYIASKTGDSQIKLDPAETGIIGGSLSYLKQVVTFKKII